VKKNLSYKSGKRAEHAGISHGGFFLKQYFTSILYTVSLLLFAGELCLNG
jgi:hypothetical protein